MRRAFLLVAVALLVANAGAFGAAAQPNDRKTVRAFLADDKLKGATTFSADVSSIYLIWKGERLEAGDQIRVVWIAEDIGAAGPKNSKIGERSFRVSKPDEEGSFFVSRPGSRVWPVGQYRAEIYVGKKLVGALGFTIQPGVNVEVH